VKNNQKLQLDVQNAIKWEPLLSKANIVVVAENGVVTLSGVVNSYAIKLEAETVAKKVMGVCTLIENIEVKLSAESIKNNNQIADEVMAQLNANWSIPKGKVNVTVEDGWVTLTGQLPWNYQKEAAVKAVNCIEGIKGITDCIKIELDTHEEIEKKDIENALDRSMSVNETCIDVSVQGTAVILSGTVSSLHQKEEAGRVAWKTPGVWYVKNELVVERKLAII
jgi:osmotically-inducible protein OsmY